MIYFRLFFFISQAMIFSQARFLMLLQFPRFSTHSLGENREWFSINLSYHFSHAIKRNGKGKKINWMSFAFFFLLITCFDSRFKSFCVEASMKNINRSFWRKALEEERKVNLVTCEDFQHIWGFWKLWNAFEITVVKFSNEHFKGVNKLKKNCLKT